MAKFTPNVPVVSTTAAVTVDIDPANPLPPGRHHFSLVVIDDAGNQSQADTIEVIVRDDSAPTAVLDVVDAAGNRVAAVVGAGKSFGLSGGRSFDFGGRITEFRFTMLPRT
ncbi:MAG: hypothetical protein ACRCUI_07525 [Polymorphobacter sp.]